MKLIYQNYQSQGGIPQRNKQRDINFTASLKAVLTAELATEFFLQTMRKKSVICAYMYICECMNKCVKQDNMFRLCPRKIITLTISSWQRDLNQEGQIKIMLVGHSIVNLDIN